MAAAKAEAWDKAQAAWAAPVAVAKAEAAAMAKAEAAWAAAAEAQALAREMQESSERKVAPPPSAASPPQASQHASQQASQQGCLTPLEAEAERATEATEQVRREGDATILASAVHATIYRTYTAPSTSTCFLPSGRLGKYR